MTSKFLQWSSVQLGSVTQSCLILCKSIDCSMPGFSVHHQFPELLKIMSVELVMPSNQLILCCPLLILPSIFPSNRVFSNESALRIRWLKYWSFGFSKHTGRTEKWRKALSERLKPFLAFSWAVILKRSYIQWSFWLKDLRGKEGPAEGIRWLQGV